MYSSETKFTKFSLWLPKLLYRISVVLDVTTPKTIMQHLLVPRYGLALRAQPQASTYAGHVHNRRTAHMLQAQHQQQWDKQRSRMIHMPVLHVQSSNGGSWAATNVRMTAVQQPSQQKHMPTHQQQSTTTVLLRLTATLYSCCITPALYDCC